MAVHPDADLFRILAGVDGDLQGLRRCGRLAHGWVNPTLPLPGVVDQDELRSVEADAEHDSVKPPPPIDPTAWFFVHVHTIVCDLVHP
ncbi:MAG: hypothetical protein M3346_06450 [Actinomycetota bacterium]|nr:hypothetical protein [Actinomycetota bacterium]